MTINLKFKATFMLLLPLALLVIVAPIAAQDAPPPPVVRLEVNPQVAKVGDAVTIAVRLENVTELYGLQVVCQVDPTDQRWMDRDDRRRRRTRRRKRGPGLGHGRLPPGARARRELVWAPRPAHLGGCRR